MSDWQVPEGFTLSVVDGHTVNQRGFLIHGGSTPDRQVPVPDGSVDVFWFDEAEPFVWSLNDGRGPQASQAAKDAARAGKPLEGWAPNGEFRPIKDGWVPPQYILRKDDDPTVGAVEPHDLAHVHGPTERVIS